MDSKAYLGVEAALRKHIGTVLRFKYNAAHDDLLHLDSGIKTGLNAGMLLARSLRAKVVV